MQIKIPAWHSSVFTRFNYSDILKFRSKKMKNDLAQFRARNLELSCENETGSPTSVWTPT